MADLGVCNEFIGEDASMNNGSTAGTPAFRAPESLHAGQVCFSKQKDKLKNLNSIEPTKRYDWLLRSIKLIERRD